MSICSTPLRGVSMRGLTILAAFCLVAVSLLPAAAIAGSPTLPESAWSSSYLLSTILAGEFEAVLDEFPVASAKDGKEAFFATDAGRNLRLRALFALDAARQRQQILQHGSRIALKLRALDSLDALTLPKDEASALTNLTETFPSEPLRHSWKQLRLAYTTSSPRCQIGSEDVRGFLAHQKALLNFGHALSSKDLLEPLAGWDLAKLQCLVFSVMATASRPGDGDIKTDASSPDEPLHLLLALSQNQPEAAKDKSVRTMLALRFFELRRYDETLRILMDLQDNDTSFRLPYDIVQRIYSIRQKGSGAVALRGL